MSEFSEKHTVSRLFGSPPGYVGYEEGGQLTEKVRRKPFSVVLFDEVEKAHPDIFNSLLQILEDGRLTDSQGRVVDFKNTVIIMTTNLGTRDIAKGVQHGLPGRRRHPKSGYERMKAKVNDELKQHFRPEFLNRVDDTIVFPQLSQDEIIQIVDLMIAKVDERLQGPGHGHRAHARGQGAAGHEGLRPGARRPAAAPHDPARRSRTSSPRRSSTASCERARSWSSTSRARARTRTSSSAAPRRRGSECRRCRRGGRRRRRGGVRRGLSPGAPLRADAPNAPPHHPSPPGPGEAALRVSGHERRELRRRGAPSSPGRAPPVVTM